METIIATEHSQDCSTVVEISMHNKTAVGLTDRPSQLKERAV